MNKKTILILLAVIIACAAGLWYFYKNNSPATQSTSVSEEEEAKIDFTQTGYLTNIGDNTSDFVLAYTEAGKPTVNIALDFSSKSACNLGAGYVKCSGTELKAGYKVEIEGVKKDDEVKVVKLNMLATDEDRKICAQVMTEARNPKTGEAKAFPSPCDVPAGWEVLLK